MKIIRLKANHLITPIGNNLDALSLSWVVAGSTAPRQKNARVEIALSNSFGFGGANATLLFRRWP